MNCYFRIITILLAICTTGGMAATTINAKDAEKAYQQKNYVEAAAIFEEYVEKTELSHNDLSDAYYNLGNCYFRMKNYGKAIVNYQRSLRIDPSNKDAQFNLELTQTKLTDRFDAPAEMFFVSWTKSLIASKSSNSWGYLGLAFILITFALCIVFMLSNRIWIRKFCFISGILSVILIVACELFAYIQYYKIKDVQLGVVMGNVQTYDSPTTTAKKQYSLHEGTTVSVQTAFEKDWLQVILPDGKITWVKNDDLEIV